MNCGECRSIIVAYVLGDLPASDSARCRSHVEGCAQCRALYNGYLRLVSEIDQQPLVAPTPSESVALAQALDRARPASRRASVPLPPGVPALIWGSIAAFFFVVSVLAMQLWGSLDLVGIARSVGPAPIALAVVITVFVTSFLPIAVAAKRRPLNGMTFRR